MFEKTGKAGEDEDTNGKEGDEKTEFLVAAMQRVTERLESGRVPCQLEDAQNSHDAEDLYDPACVLDLSCRDPGRLGQRQRDEIRHDREQVDDVERRSHVLQSAPQFNTTDSNN